MLTAVEHIRHWRLFIRDPAYTVTLLEEQQPKWGWFWLSPEALETSLMVRVCDVLELEWLDQESWPEVWVRFTSIYTEATWETELKEFLLYARKQKIA